MFFVLLIPVVWSILLISAHFLFHGMMILTVVSLLIPLILIYQNRWSPRLVQIYLVLSAIEWIRTAVNGISERIQYGLPWHRLAAILIAAAIVSLLSSLVFRAKVFQNHYVQQQNKKLETE